MANQMFNIALGRVAEFYVRVDGNDPANATFELVVIDANGETDADFLDFDDLSAALVTANEVTNTNYARSTGQKDDTDLAAFAPDDTNNRVDLDMPDTTWSAIAAGDAWTDIIVGYDSDSTGGTDANIVPCTLHDFVVTPDGSDITAQVANAGWYRAS